MRYVIRCSGCGGHAPLAGELLSEFSEQVVAFQADHDHATGGILVDRVAALVVLDGTAAERVPARSAA